MTVHAFGTSAGPVVESVHPSLAVGGDCPAYEIPLMQQYHLIVPRCPAKAFTRTASVRVQPENASVQTLALLPGLILPKNMEKTGELADALALGLSSVRR